MTDVPEPAAGADPALLAAHDALADRMVAAGVSSILNFAPAIVTVPDGMSLRKVDLAVELQILSFYQQRRSDPSAGKRAAGDG